MFSKNFQNLVAKRALLAPVRPNAPLVQSVQRGFSAGKGATFGQGLAGMCAIGGTAGLTMLCYKGHMTRIEMMKSPEMQRQMFHPIVQDRLRKTMGYFSAASAGTGAFMFFLRNSSIVNMNPFLLLGLTFGSMIALHSVDYEQNWMLKNVLYAGFVGLISTSLVPLIHMYSMPILFDALMATGVTVGGLGAVAWNAPSQQFLNWGGPLALGCGGMLGISLLGMFFPGSPALYNMWLYGGLALFSGFVLYDTQMVVARAKSEQRFDPIANSIHIYMDAINIFVRFAAIFGNSKK